MKRRIAQGLAVLLGIGTFATLLMLGVSLARNPFAAPWVDRETEALALRIDRKLAAEFGPEIRQPREVDPIGWTGIAIQ